MQTILRCKLKGGDIVARMGIYQIPTEIKDQDKWFTYFTKKQAVVLVATGILDYRMIMGAGSNGMLLPAILISILITGVMAALVLIHLPADELFLSGGGIMLDQWLLRIYIRKKNKIIYVKNYLEEETT